MADSSLPSGFVLDTPAAGSASSVPAGFTLDSPQQMAAEWRARTGAPEDVPTPFDRPLPSTAPSTSLGDKLEQYSSAAGDALTAGLMRAKSGSELIAGGIPAALGDTRLSDYIFGKVQAENEAADRKAAFAAGYNKPGAITGNVLSFAPYILGGEAALPARAGEVTGLIPRMVSGVTRALPTAATIGTQQAVQQATQVIKAGGSAEDAEKAYLAALPTDTAVNLLPAGVPGSLPLRLASGTVIAAGGQAAAQEAQHLASPKYIPAPTWQDATQQGVLGGLMAGAFGHGAAPEPLPLDPFLQRYAESHAEPPASAATPRALPAPTVEPAPSVAPPAPPGEAPAVSPSEAFLRDPTSALQALDHATVKQIAEDAGFTVKPGDTKPSIISKVVGQGKDYLASDVLPEYLSAVKAPPAVAPGSATEGSLSSAAGTQAAPSAQPLGSVPVVPVDRSGTAYTPAQGGRTFAQALDEARGQANRLPAPVTTVDRAGIAVDSGAFSRALDEAREAAQRRLDLGLTPDIERVQGQHPGLPQDEVIGEHDLTPTDPEFQGKQPWWMAGQDAKEQAAREAGKAGLQKAVPGAPEPLPASTPVDTSHDVTLGGGVAKDNSRIYIDRGIPEEIPVPKEDGSGDTMVNVHQDIAFHEAVEKPELDQGTHYFDAHEQNANHAEDAYLMQKYGVRRAAVDKALQPYLDAAAAKNPETSNIPADLDRKPYEDGGDTAMLPEASNELAKLGIPEELHQQALQFLNHVERALEAGIPAEHLKDIARTDDDLPSKLARIDQLIGETGHDHTNTGNPKAEGVPRETATAALRQAGQAGESAPQQGPAEAGRPVDQTEQQPATADRSDQLAEPTRGIDLHTGLPLNDDGTVTVYHHTSPEAAAEIRKTGILKSAGEPHVYVTTRKETDTGYGSESIPIRINPAKLTLDDEFPNGRKDFSIPVGKQGVRIRVDDTNMRETANAGSIPVALRRADWNAPTEGRAITELDSLVQRYGGSTLADSIANDLREHTTAQLIGQQVHGPEDLAALASIYRNPAFETMRYVYVDRAGNVLGETAVSSRMPSTTHVFPTGTEDGAAWVRDKAPDGATGVWLIHNHPTGDPTASQPDIAVTRSLSIRLGDMPGAPQLQGHVILDHNTYGHIDDLGEWRGVQELSGGPDVDPLRYGRGDFEMFDQKVTSPDFAATTGKRIAAATPEDSSAVVVMDAKGRVTSVHTFPNDFLVTPRGAAMLSRLGQKRGAVGLGVVMSTSNFAKHREAFNAASQRGLLRDAVVVSPEGRALNLAGTDLFPQGQRKNYGQQSAGAKARAGGAVQAFENTPSTEPPLVSLSAVRRALADRGMSPEQIQGMSAEQLRAEQANLRRRSSPAPEEVQSGTDSFINKATVDEERAMKGQAALEFDLRRSNSAALNEAKAALARDPRYGLKLAQELADKPHATTQAENMALALDKLRIKNQTDAAYSAIKAAQDAGNANDEAGARAQMRILEAQMDANQLATRRGLGLSAQALQSGGYGIKDDYSLAKLLSDGKAAAGGELKSSERSRLEKLAEDIAAREKALAEREAALQNARREPRKPAEQKSARSKFDSLAEQLKAIAQKDHLKPGCVV